MPLGRLGTESEVSAAIVFLLRDAAAFITGTGCASMAACRWQPLDRPAGDGQVAALRRLPSRAHAKVLGGESAMPVLESQIDRNSDEFKRNRAAHAGGDRGFRAAEASVQATSEQARPAFEKRGQLLPRERVAPAARPRRAVPGAVPLAGYRMHDDKDGSSAGGGSIAGIGYVAGVRCVVSASNSGIKGGTMAPMGLRKSLRAQEIALENKLPLVHLVEIGGANLLYQAEIFVAGGRGFANLARLSARGIPQITVVHGSSTAGGAYLPGLSRLRDHGAQPGQGVPRRPAAAEGRDRRDRDRRGAGRRRDARHGLRPRRVPGRGRCRRHPHRARDHRQARHWNDALPPPARTGRSSEPRYDADELLGVVPPSTTASPTTCARSSRASSTAPTSSSSRRLYGRRRSAARPRSRASRSASSATTARSTPRARSRPRSSSSSAARPGTPLVYLQNTTGYMVGTEAERGGIIKHGSKMIQAVANATRAAAHHRDRRLLRRRQLRHVRPRLRPALHLRLAERRIAVMGGEQAAGMMEIVTEQSRAQRQGAAEPTQIDKMIQDDRRPVRRASRPRSTPRPGCGTTA